MLYLLGYNKIMSEKSIKPKSTKDGKKWQNKIEKSVKKEKVELEHPQGKERFERAIVRAAKKQR